MQIFGIDLWRIILCIFLIVIVVNRANIVAIYAKGIYAKGNFKKALKVYNIADKIGNMNTKNKTFYGYALLRDGEVEKGQIILRGLLPYTKENRAARYQLKNLLALASWKSGYLDDAIEELEEVVSANYKTTVVYQNLGILYNLKGDFDKALKFNLEAYEYNSDDNIILDNLADSYAKSGDLKKARELYEELLARDPEPHFPECYYGYGEVLIKLGEKEKGIEMIEKSLTKTFAFFSIKTKEEVEAMLEEYRKQ